MSRFEYYIHRDCNGYTAKDKEAVVDILSEGPKTVAELATITGLDARHVSNVVRNIEGLGVIKKAGRGCQGRIRYEVKA